MKTISIRKWNKEYIGVSKNYMSVPYETIEETIKAMEILFPSARIIDNTDKKALA